MLSWKAAKPTLLMSKIASLKANILGNSTVMCDEMLVNSAVVKLGGLYCLLQKHSSCEEMLLGLELKGHL